MLKAAKRYTLDWVDYIYIVVGSLILAISFQAFLLPNNIVAGGVSGLSIVTYEVFGWNPAYFQYAVNIPLLILCFVVLGKEVGYKTILGSLLVPFFLQFLGDLPAATNDSFLATVFGGGITGLGLGLVFRAKSSTGGTSVIIQIFYQVLRMPLGISTFLIDGAVIFTALLVFDVETVMYAAISLFLMSRVIDLVQMGFKRNKNVMIISPHAKQIRKEILHTLDRGVTSLSSRGGYKEKEAECLMTVIQEREFPVLKEIVSEIDADAFVVAMSASEVLGRGFSLHKYFPLNEEEVNRY
jgi:uncharacterized membrane-anchored protein YitT (DUF2179 family)